MNLFDSLVNEALKTDKNLAILRNVVEKELLQHDILRIMSECDLLQNLTFIGGTCLRLCYGAIRLSEDLDFTGGLNFSRHTLKSMGKLIEEQISIKYDLAVKVTEPIKDKLDVDTWKISIQTKPQTKHLPSQRINIDICSTPSYEKKPVLLINPYPVDMGTSGLIILAQSKEEIFIDKILAFALRPNRIKYRDIWDLTWLKGKAIEPNFSLIKQKLSDRNIPFEKFLTIYQERSEQLHSKPELRREFYQEMSRFLPQEHYLRLEKQENFWAFICDFFKDLEKSFPQN